MADIAEECVATGAPINSPAVLLSGGERTVTVQGDGTGGPNQEFALSAAIELDISGVTVASLDTDRIDDASEAGGGIATWETTVPRREACWALDDNDAGRFLNNRNGVIRTGR